MSDEKAIIIQTLSHAGSILNGKINTILFPVTGVQLAYAKKGARDFSDIASICGGIQKDNNGLIPFEVGFGESGLIATVLLTAMKFDPSIRSAAIIACTSGTLRMMEGRFFEICSFDPLVEPPGIRSMDWGVAQCCRNGVPDAIYSRHTGDKDAIIRLLGEDPLEVANNILMLSV
jgi:thiamine-phosphate diphosphorylase